MTATGIQIGGNIDKPGVAAAADAVAHVLLTAYTTHAEQETLRVALTTLGRFGSVTGATVTNSTVTFGHD